MTDYRLELDLSILSFQLPRCQKAMRQSCIDQFDSMNCGAAVNFCDNELSAPLRASGMYISTTSCFIIVTDVVSRFFVGRNNYDISKVNIKTIVPSSSRLITTVSSPPSDVRGRRSVLLGKRRHQSIPRSTRGKGTVRRADTVQLFGMLWDRWTKLQRPYGQMGRPNTVLCRGSPRPRPSRSHLRGDV